MRGARWTSVKYGYKKFLGEIKKMNNVIVSTFSFDGNINHHIKAVNPSEAYELIEKIPNTLGQDTNYIMAMETMVEYMQNSGGEYDNYCRFLVFLSDGGGDFPKASLTKIQKFKKEGMKMVFYTVSCATDEEETMIEMAKTLNGEHYKVMSPEASKIIFTQILGV